MQVWREGCPVRVGNRVMLPIWCYVHTVARSLFSLMPTSSNRCFYSFLAARFNSGDGI